MFSSRCLLAIAIISLVVPSALGQGANQIGQWQTLPYLMPINPIHVGVLRDGRVLVIAGSENDPGEHDDGISRGAVYDWQSGTIIVQDLLWDLFCNGFSFLADGRVFIIGGTEAYDEFTGEQRATIFDPATDQFVQVESMQDGRWYATSTTLPDGRVMAFSGLDLSSNTNSAVEFYKIGDGWSPEYLAPWEPPLYPWLHVLPNGQLVFTGSTRDSHLFDPATQTWTLRIARTKYNGNRFYGSSVLLPLLPQNGYAARVMILGGDSPATRKAEVLDLSQAVPAWRALPQMSQPRVQMNAVLLPDGKVLAQGGSQYDEDEQTASKPADLFNPVTETWSPAGTAAFARLYHSVALLLPDATVWTAGSNPERGTWDPHMEIYSPPYLFTTDGGGAVIPATRPTISDVPEVIGYGSTFALDTPDDLAIASIALMRPGSNTHAFDMEQRMVSLTFSLTAPGTLTVGEPPNANIAPPGYYMVFIVNSAGVPSVAKFVQVSPTPVNHAPSGTIVTPSGDVTIAEGASVNFTSTGSDPDGGAVTYHWIFPDGVPDTSSAQNPGNVMFDEAGTYVVSLTVIDGVGANDPSPPTRTITVVAGQAPGAPTNLGSPDHTVSVWSQNPSVTVTWTAPGDPGGSGIDGYSVLWDHVVNTTPDMVKDVEEAPTSYVQSLASSAAGWYFHIMAKDNLGSWGPAAHFGPILIDTVAPGTVSGLTSSDHTVNVWSSVPLVTTNWTAATDAESGLDGYSVIWDHTATTTPDTVKDLEETATSFQQTLASSSTGWYLHIRARDNAGNWGSAVHFGPILIDTATPGTVSALTSSDHTVNVWSSVPLVTTNWTAATDAESGLDGYSVMWDHTATATPDTTKDIEETATSFQQTLTSSSTGWYFHIRAVDNAGNWGSASHFGPVLIDTNVPGTVSGLTSSDHTVNVWSSVPLVTTNWTAATDAESGLDGYSVVWDHTAATTPDTVKDLEETATSFQQTLSSSSTGWYFHIRARDNAGNWGNASHFGPVLIDTVSPGTVSGLTSSDHTVNVWSSVPLVTTNWTAATDAESGLDGYSVVWDHTATTTPDTVKDLEETATSFQQTLTSSSTGWYFHIRAVDNSGNWGSASHFGPVLIDTNVPGTVSGLTSSDHTVNVWSSIPLVTTNWTAATDAESGLDGYSVIWDHTATTTPDTTKDIEETATSFQQTLANSSTGWYFHIRARDNAGNWGNASHFGPVLIDTTTPGAVNSLTSPDHTVNVWSTDLLVTTTWDAAVDGESGLDGYSVIWDQSAATTPDAVKDLEETATSFAQTLSSSSAGWYFHIRAVDSVGNWGSAVHFGPILIDTQSPSGGIAIDGGAATTGSLLVTLDLSAIDAESGMGAGATMQFSNDGVTFSAEEPFATSKASWDLSLFGGDGEPGSKTVHVRYRDVAGNQSGAFVDSIDYTPMPGVLALSPDHGPYGGGTVVTITGTGFVPGATVKFGALSATSVTYVSSTQLVAVTPVYSGGPFGSLLVRVDVSVTTSGGAGVLPKAYRYQLPSSPIRSP